MRERLINFECAKLASLKGFNEYTEMGYDNQGRLSYPHYGSSFRNSDWDNSINYSAPTITLLQKWLREEHKIDVFANSVRFTGYIEIGYYTYSVLGITPIKNYRFDTYEEALEIALIEGLKLIL